MQCNDNKVYGEYLVWFLFNRAAIQITSYSADSARRVCTRQNLQISVGFKQEQKAGHAVEFKMSFNSLQKHSPGALTFFPKLRSGTFFVLGAPVPSVS